MDQEYVEIVRAKKALPGALEPGYIGKHRVVAERLEKLIRRVEIEGVFSANEESDDIATGSLQFLDLWYLYGQLLEVSKLDPWNDRILGRMLILHGSIRAYLNFCGLLHDYQLLPPPLAQFYKRVSSRARFDLTKAQLSSSRESKIEMYALSKGASEVWQEHREKLRSDRDEEVQRGAYFAKLGYEAIEAWKSIAGNIQELELLANMAQVKPEDALREGHLVAKETTFADAKKRDDSMRVDLHDAAAAATSGPVVGPKGKVLRPFTLTRQGVKSTVMGTGQVLPSMSVEEFVDQELRNGGMVQPQQEEPEDDEDDMEFQDRETERLRRWDEFTEANPKGSGNTMNLG